MEWTSPKPDLAIPDLPLTDFLLGGLRPQDLDRIAVLDHQSGESLTYGQVVNQTDAFATWLAARGLGTGSVVAICLPNCPTYLPVFHGAARSGAASTLVNASYTADEIARQLEITRAAVLVAHAGVADRALAAARTAGLDEDAVVLVGAEPAGAVVAWGDVLATPPDPPVVDIDPARHVVALPFSSGTSGLPKAVMLTHRNLLANLLMFDDLVAHLDVDLPVLAFLPYSHVFSLNVSLNWSLYRRSTQYTLSSFDPMVMLAAIQERRPALLCLVPTVAVFLAKHPAVTAFDLSSLRLVVSGSAPLAAPLATAVEQRVGARVIQGYGMTELSTCTHVVPPDRPDIDPGSVGFALRNVRFRVVDPASGRDVDVPATGPSEPGELWCSGPNVMLGYFGVPADADATLDAAGWIHTGDLVTVDAAGVVHVVDRLKELIKRQGLQIAPVELECVLAQHPDVADAAVLGVTSASATDQTPVALVQLRPDAAASGPDLLRFVADRVAPHKQLGGVHFVPTIPRSAAGKIQRRKLPALLQAR